MRSRGLRPLVVGDRTSCRLILCSCQTAVVVGVSLRRGQLWTAPIQHHKQRGTRRRQSPTTAAPINQLTREYAGRMVYYAIMGRPAETYANVAAEFVSILKIILARYCHFREIYHTPI